MFTSQHFVRHVLTSQISVGVGVGVGVPEGVTGIVSVGVGVGTKHGPT
jgi:hypothetical protein